MLLYDYKNICTFLLNIIGDFKDDAMTTSLPTFSDFPIDLSTSTLHSSTIYNSFATLVPTSFEQKGKSHSFQAIFVDSICI